MTATLVPRDVRIAVECPLTAVMEVRCALWLLSFVIDIQPTTSSTTAIITTITSPSHSFCPTRAFCGLPPGWHVANTQKLTCCFVCRLVTVTWNFCLLYLLVYGCVSPKSMQLWNSFTRLCVSACVCRHSCMLCMELVFVSFFTTLQVNISRAQGEREILSDT